MKNDVKKDLNLIKPQKEIKTNNIISTYFNDEIVKQRIREIKSEFQLNDYALVSELIPTKIKYQIRNEVFSSYESNGIRRDIHLKETANTPRKMTNIRYIDLKETCPIVEAVYQNSILMEKLSYIAGENLYSCPWENERYISTRLESAGDTHGWHWDDYSFTLIWILEAPLYGNGGELEIVPNTSWNKKKPDIENIVLNTKTQTKHHRTFDLYLFRSDKTLHRVLPISKGSQRTILNMVWASQREMDKNITHETMNDLFA